MDTVRDKQAQTILDMVFKEGLFKENPSKIINPIELQGR